MGSPSAAIVREHVCVTNKDIDDENNSQGALIAALDNKHFPSDTQDTDEKEVQKKSDGFTDFAKDRIKANKEFDWLKKSVDDGLEKRRKDEGDRQNKMQNVPEKDKQVLITEPNDSHDVEMDVS